ncbi:guanine nucleotide-binding protein subunit beta-like protein 1 isoform X2 [Bacillus rossius redtenbacheri]
MAGMSDPEPRYILRSSLPAIHCAHFWKSGGRDVLLCGCEDGNVYSWDLETARTDGVPTLAAGAAQCLSLSSAGDLLVTQDRSGRVGLWSQGESAWTQLRSIALDYSGFCRVCVSGGGDDLLVCPQRVGTLEVYSAKTAGKVSALPSSGGDGPGKLGEVMTAKLVHLSGVPYVIAAYENCEIHLWDLRAEHSISKYLLPKCPIALEFDDTLGLGLCGNVSRKIPVFKLEKTGTFTTVAEIKLPAPGVSCVRMEPERKFVAVGCWNKTIQFISWKDKVASSPVQITVHKDVVQDICFSPWSVPSWESKCLMAACSKDSQVSLWDFLNVF